MDEKPTDAKAISLGTVLLAYEELIKAGKAPTVSVEESERRWASARDRAEQAKLIGEMLSGYTRSRPSLEEMFRLAEETQKRVEAGEIKMLGPQESHRRLAELVESQKSFLRETLRDAAANGQTEIVELLVEHGSDEVDEALILAAEGERNADTVKFLLAQHPGQEAINKARDIAEKAGHTGNF